MCQLHISIQVGSVRIVQSCMCVHQYTFNLRTVSQHSIILQFYCYWKCHWPLDWNESQFFIHYIGNFFLLDYFILLYIIDYSSDEKKIKKEKCSNQCRFEAISRRKREEKIKNKMLSSFSDWKITKTVVFLRRHLSRDVQITCESVGLEIVVNEMCGNGKYHHNNNNNHNAEVGSKIHRLVIFNCAQNYDGHTNNRAARYCIHILIGFLEFAF